MAESLSRPQFGGNSGAKFDDIARLFDSFVLVPSEMEVQRHVGVLLVKRKPVCAARLFERLEPERDAANGANK